MAIVTPMYLAFELGFNASLLNTTGTLVSFSQVQDIEQWGRIISGVALALFVWGVVLLPLAEALRVRLSIVFALLLATLALSIMFTFDVEKHIVDSRADQ
jgi:amino acid permease